MFAAVPGAARRTSPENAASAVAEEYIVGQVELHRNNSQELGMGAAGKSRGCHSCAAAALEAVAHIVVDYNSCIIIFFLNILKSY